MAAASASAGRQRVYERLVWRNRLVGLLRLLVPVSGALALGVLGVALYASTIAGDFSIGTTSVDRDTLVIAEPRYSGLLDNGSTYQVGAAAARAVMSALDMLNVTDGTAVLKRPDGVALSGTATTAILDSTNQVLTVTGRANISDSRGLKGWMEQAVVDYPNQRVTTTGPVSFVLDDGSQIEGASMDYDQKSRVWRFTQVTVTMPATPGELL
jgi:lipopolysaccharide export system protein LptC